MKDNVTDLNKFKGERLRKNKEEHNTNLFIQLVTKNKNDLTDEEMFDYMQIQIHNVFIYKNKASMWILEFKNVMYLVNCIHPKGEQFEYIGKLDDIVGHYLGQN